MSPLVCVLAGFHCIWLYFSLGLTPNFGFLIKKGFRTFPKKDKWVYGRTSSNGYLSTMATATKLRPQLPKKPLDHGQFSWLTRKSRTVRKFDPYRSYGAFVINRGKSYSAFKIKCKCSTFFKNRNILLKQSTLKAKFHFRGNEISSILNAHDVSDLVVDTCIWNITFLYPKYII